MKTYENHFCQQLFYHINSLNSRSFPVLFYHLFQDLSDAFSWLFIFKKEENIPNSFYLNLPTTKFNNRVVYFLNKEIINVKFAKSHVLICQSFELSNPSTFLHWKRLLTFFSAPRACAAIPQSVCLAGAGEDLYKGFNLKHIGQLERDNASRHVNETLRGSWTWLVHQYFNQLLLYVWNTK